MEDEPPTKQIKLSEADVGQAAIELINKAKHYKPPNQIERPISSAEAPMEWNALDIISIHIVFNEVDFYEPKRSFKPKLAHQIFGQKEKMLGFHFPKIELYFLANSAKSFLKFTHEGIYNSQIDIVTAKMFDNLINWLPEDNFIDENKFLEAIKHEQSTKMFGKKLRECDIYNYKNNSQQKFIMRECLLEEPGFAEFHSRFQCLIVWYIDAASQLDLEDPNWMFIYVYEEICVPETREIGYYPVGYCAVYKFYNYPDKIRARISQCFVLPCCQRMGVGNHLLQATYQSICSLPNAIDITVEDPCPSFQRLRDTVDSNLLKDLDCFKYPQIKNGFTNKMMNEANSLYKINKRQCRRVFHILRMAYTFIYKENDQTLIGDINCHLGLLQSTASKCIYDIRMEKEQIVHEEIKIPSVVEKYIRGIQPIAWRLSESLKKEILC